MNSIKVIIILSWLLALSGCQTQPPQEKLVATVPDKPRTVPEPPPLPFAVETSDLAELSEDIIFDYLAAEIGAQRGALQQSFDYYLQVAAITRDSYAAERATKIALHLDNQSAALRASRLWVEIAPNAIPARQVYGLLELSEGRLDSAGRQFDALLQIAAAKRMDGYLIIAKLLIGKKFQGDNVRLMRLLLENHMDVGSAHYALAFVEYDASLHADAIKSLDTAIQLRPDWEAPRILQAGILSDQGKIESSLRLLQKAIAEIPTSIELPIAYSRQLIQLKRYPQALDVLTVATKLDPKDTEVLLAKGLLETELGFYPRAKKTWQQLRDIDSTHNEATYYLAQTEALDGQLETAIGLYASVNNGPLAIDAQLHLAQLLAETGQLPQARDLYRELRVLEPDRAIDIYTFEARTLIEQGEIEAAFTLYSAAIATNPEDIELRYNRGILASENNKLPTAIDDFKFILKIQPDHADTLNALGYTLADLTDRYDEAFVYIMQAYKLKPENPAVLDSLGWVYFRMGNLPEALKYLQLANAQSPDAEIAAHLGEVLWISGKQAQARKIWQEALLREPESNKLLEAMQRLQ